MMKSLARWMLLTALTLATVAGSAAVAPGVSDGDARAVRGIIRAQLEALAAGDAALAFSYASPSIRMQFGDARSFMTMVIQGYPMVIGPVQVAFFRPEVFQDTVMQDVYLRDQAGRSWLATYQLQPQSDGSWRINGCSVLPGDGKALT